MVELSLHRSRNALHCSIRGWHPSRLAGEQILDSLPSQPALYKDPAVLDYKKEFMSNAPTGQIFAATAENLKPQYLGKKNGPTRVAVENGVGVVRPSPS